MMIFRHQSDPGIKKKPYYLSAALVLVFFFGLVWWHMREVRFGLYFVGGSVALVLVTALLTHFVLWVLGRQPVRHLVARQAIKGLFRRGNTTQAILITLTTALAVIYATYLLEMNLDAAFVKSYPETAPNVFFVDIQRHQQEAFVQTVGRPTILFPVVRARVTAINGKPINRLKERRKRRDNFSRVFNLTYRHHLLTDESIVKGKTLFQENGPDIQVSILDTVREMQPMDVGDTIQFKIQGVPLEGKISSIRTRNRSSFSPFFYFVLPEKVLGQAPQTLFAALKVPQDELGALQRRIVSQFPNISVIDMSQTIGVFVRLTNQLSRIIRAFSLFSIAAGLLILTSAIYATRAERIQESVYYKILGAGRRFVFKIFALENLLIGLLSSFPALILAQAAAFWVCHHRLEIHYQLFILPSVTIMTVTLLLVMAIGLAASRSIMAKKPVVYLRERNDA